MTTMYYNKKTAIYPKSKGVSIGKGERGDCTIRAAVNAGAGNYQIVHKIFKFYGRKNREATYLDTWIRSYIALGIKLMGVFGTTSSALVEARTLKQKGYKFELFKGITIKNFIKTYSKGKFICMTKDHAFTIIDGNLIDLGPLLLNTRITTVFLVK